MGQARSTESAVGSRIVMAFVILWTAPTSALEPPLVGVTDQRVQLDVDGKTLIVEATVENALEVALRSVDVGWLLAASEAQLAAIKEPGLLYLDAEDPKHVAPPAGVVVIRRSIVLAVPARGKAVARLRTPMTDGEPAVYRTHILGYALADASLELALRLLRGSAASDEVAAVDYAALNGGLAEKKRARESLRAGKWMPALTKLLSTPVRPPTPEVLHERVFGIRALGVSGGQDARDVLEALRDCEDMAGFDESLRLMLIDRLRGNRLETPLAFAVPVTARKMADVFDAAIADAKSDFAVVDGIGGLEHVSTVGGPPTAVPVAAGEVAADDLAVPEDIRKGVPPIPGAASFRKTAWLACGIVLAVALIALRRRK